MLWRNNTYLRALQSAALRPFQVTEITTKTWRCNKYATGSPEGPSLRIWQRWLVLTTSMTGHSWGTPYGMAVKVLLEMINQERRFTPNMNTLLNELGSTESKEKKKPGKGQHPSLSALWSTQMWGASAMNFCSHESYHVCPGVADGAFKPATMKLSS